MQKDWVIWENCDSTYFFKLDLTKSLEVGKYCYTVIEHYSAIAVDYLNVYKVEQTNSKDCELHIVRIWTLINEENLTPVFTYECKDTSTLKTACTLLGIDSNIILGLNN